ncbi:uncharacterized protein LOC120632142 [Pararge aegeria]|uniref:Jg4171 protein n=1 Tax=Pararge aegeria aegeria TaxID=348720 RepID=A0A8S4SC23_9NEOP|nr:uncharacterized protein LOC120632142 [Pararge aegeria]CAH2258415.1 jg4171 [Pararge aegeria aegeria]
MESKRRKVIRSESREMIAKVYHFLKEEYAFMAAYNNDKCDLTPLRNIRQRTADATGVSTGTVTRILKQEKNLPSPTSQFTSSKKKHSKKENEVNLVEIYIKQEKSDETDTDG